jgi:hypothetical protein
MIGLRNVNDRLIRLWTASITANVTFHAGDPSCSPSSAIRPATD